MTAEAKLQIHARLSTTPDWMSLNVISVFTIKLDLPSASVAFGKAQL